MPRIRKAAGKDAPATGAEALARVESPVFQALESGGMTRTLESEEQFRVMAEAMPQLVWTASADGIVTYYNSRAKYYAGIRQRAEGDWVWEGIVHPDDLARTTAEWSTASRTGKPYECEHRVQMSTGEYRWHLSRAICMEIEGQTRWFGTATDIHDMRTAQERLEQLNQSLERTVAERTAQLQQYAASLRRLATEAMNAEQRERTRLSRILHDGLQQLLVAVKLQLPRSNEALREGALERLSALVDEAIESSRSLAFELSPPILSEAGLPEALHWLARWFSRTHGFTVDISAPSIKPRLPQELKECLFNCVRELVFNSVKYSGVDRCDVTLTVGTREVQVTISDAGRGFEANELVYTGQAGLGLFSVQERLQAFGGKLECASSPGEGARFTLTLPIQDSETRPAKKKGASPSGIDVESRGEGPLRVLVVDDHKIVRQGIITLLEQEENLEVVGAAADGAQAVELVESARPHVVVMDVNMPVMNGIEAARQIKRLYPDVKIIGLSLYSEKSQGRTMCEAGASAYLQKDGPVEQLVQTIWQVCGAPAESR